MVSIVDEDGKLKLDETRILKLTLDEAGEEAEEEVKEVIFTNAYENPGRGEVEEKVETEENPYTYDNVSLFISLYVLSLIGFIGAVIYAKKEA